MGKFNKATAAVIAGAIASAVGAFFALDATVVDAVQVILVAASVWLIPNV